MRSFVLTNHFSDRTRRHDRSRRPAVIRFYPQIYLACHVEHRSRANSPTGLTAREASILAHVDDPAGTSPARLARHLGVAASTLSAALARLERQGMVAIDADPGDARRRLVRLTARGRTALAAGSVLDPERLAAMLGAMDAEDAAAGGRGARPARRGGARMAGGDGLMLWWLIWIAAGLAGLILLVCLVGALLPRDHVAAAEPRWRRRPRAWRRWSARSRPIRTGAAG